MAIGPVQLIVIGFNHPDFHGEIIAELERLHDEDTVRVIDALAVHKDADGEIEVVHLSNLSKDEAIELGSKVGALIGLGIEGEEGAEQGAELGAEAAADGVEVFSDEQAWDVLRRSQTTRPRRSCCSSITGRSRCETRSCARAVSGLVTASLAPSTWSKSGSCRPRRPRNCTPSRQPEAPARTQTKEA